MCNDSKQIYLKEDKCKDIRMRLKPIYYIGDEQQECYHNTHTPRYVKNANYKLLGLIKISLLQKQVYGFPPILLWALGGTEVGIEMIERGAGHGGR